MIDQRAVTQQWEFQRPALACPIDGRPLDIIGRRTVRCAACGRVMDVEVRLSRQFGRRNRDAVHDGDTFGMLDPTAPLHPLIVAVMDATPIGGRPRPGGHR